MYNNCIWNCAIYFLMLCVSSSFSLTVMYFIIVSKSLHFFRSKKLRTLKNTFRLISPKIPGI